MRGIKLYLPRSDPRSHYPNFHPGEFRPCVYTRLANCRDGATLWRPATHEAALSVPRGAAGFAKARRLIFRFVADHEVYGRCCACCRPLRLRRSRSSACSPEPLCETTAAHAWSATALRGAKWHCTLPASGARYAGAWPQNRTPHTTLSSSSDITHGCSGASRQRCGSSTKSLSTRPTLSSSRATFPPRRRKLISTAPKARK